VSTKPPGQEHLLEKYGLSICFDKLADGKNQNPREKSNSNQLHGRIGHWKPLRIIHLKQRQGDQGVEEIIEHKTGDTPQSGEGGSEIPSQGRQSGVGDSVMSIVATSNSRGPSAKSSRLPRRLEGQDLGGKSWMISNW
jgi:hypothetical protein